MSLTEREAKNEFLEYFRVNWEDGIANGLPNSNPALPAIDFQDASGESYTPEVYWPNVEKTEPSDPEKHFVQIHRYNLRSPQSSLTGGRIDGGITKFTTSGVGIIQLFFSKTNYTSDGQDLLTAIVHEMFLGKRSENIWFRNATVKDMPPEERHFRTDVDFQYEFDTHLNCPV